MLRFRSALLPALTAALVWAADPVGSPHVYKKVEGRELRLWVRTPDNSTAKTARPAIVFIHGGGWTGGNAGAFAPQSDYLASRGMVAVEIEYRLLQRGTTDPPVACIQDAKSAMRWVREHAAEFGIDPNRIAASGGSAGGHLAAFLGLMDGFDDPGDDLTVSVRPNALVLFNPVFDNGPGGWGHERTGSDYMKYSPFHHINAAAPPTVVFSGANDKLIPAATVVAFCEAMRKAGVRCEATIFPGEEHGFFNTGQPFYQTLKATDEFLTSLGWLHGAPTLRPEAAPVRAARPASK